MNSVGNTSASTTDRLGKSHAFLKKLVKWKFQFDGKFLNSLQLFIHTLWQTFLKLGLFSQYINNIFKQACQRERKNDSKILRRSGYFGNFWKQNFNFLYPDFNDFYLFPIDGIGLPPPLVGQNSTIFGFENEAYNSSPMRKVWYN